MASATPPAKRGRKPETAAQRVESLARRLADAKVAAKEAQRRRFAVVGAAMMEEAEGDDEFRRKLVDVLRRRVTQAGAKADIAELLI